MSVDPGALRLLGLVAPPPPDEEEEEDALEGASVDRGALRLLGLDRAPSTLPPAPGMPPEEKVAQEPDTAVQRQGPEPTFREYVPSSSLVQPAPPPAPAEGYRPGEILPRGVEDPGEMIRQAGQQALNMVGRGGRDLVQGLENVSRATAGAVGGAGQLIEQAGNLASQNVVTRPFAPALQGIGGDIAALGEAQIPVRPPLPEGEERTLRTAFAPREGEDAILDDVLRGAPSFAAGIASFVAGGPPAAAAVMGSQEFGSQYNRGLEEGRSEEEALVSASLYAPASALLETYGAGKVISKAFPQATKRQALDFAKRWTQSFLAEGSTETTQDVASNLSALVAGAAERGMSFEDLAGTFSEENLQQYGRTFLVSGLLGQAPVLATAGMRPRQPPAPEAPQPTPPAEVGERVSANPEDVVDAVAPEEVPLPPEEVPAPAPPVAEEAEAPQKRPGILDRIAEAVEGPAPPERRPGEVWMDRERGAYEVLPEGRVRWEDSGEVGSLAEAPEVNQRLISRPEPVESVAAPEEAGAPVAEPLPPEPAVVASPGEAGFAKIASTPEQRLPPYEFQDSETEGRYREALKGVQQPSLLTRARESLRATGRAFSREHVLIPHGAFHAPVRESLRRVAASPEVSVDRVALALHESISPLASEEYDLFLRSSLVENLQGVKEVYGPDTPIPFGFDEASLSEESSRLEGQLAANPKVQQARDAMRQTWTEIRQETRDAFEAANLPTDFLDSQGDAYLHHQILEYASLDPKAGGKLRSPTGRGFQRALKGSEKDFNLRYAQAQGRVMSQLLVDAELARQLVNIRKKYSDPVKTEAKKAAKEAGDTRSWKEHLPEGYGIWQPREGSHFFMGQSVTERLASEIMTKGVKEVSGQDLREMMMVGGRREEYVLPQEIIDTLEHAGRRIDNDMLRGLVRGNEKLQRGWKVWQLLQPRRQVKYLGRNIIGDGSKVLSGNPSTYRHGNISTAAKELAASLYGKRSQVSPELAAWKLRGGLSSGLFQQEIEASEAERLRRLVESPRFQASLRELAASPKKLGQMYWTKTRQNAKFLESLLRYATFRDYLRQVKADPEGKPKNYGASVAAEIDALEDPADKAYWLSNELIGAYDMVSAGGQFLRRELLPFWSFQELNVRSHYRLLRNALRDDRVAGSFARKAGITTARYGTMGALRAGKFLALAYALEVMLHAWNHALFPDEEEELSAFIKKSPHIILGRRENGEILYFNRLGVWNEFREWFGIDEFGMSVVEYLNGRKSPKEVALDTALPIVDKAVSTIGGLGLAGSTKMLMEGLTRTSTFPSATRPSRIPDVPDWLARSFGVEHEFRALTDRPMPTGGKTSSERWARSVPEAFLYSQDPGSAAYYDILNLKDRYLRHIGEEGGGYSWSARSSALRNYKRAIRFDEPDLAEKYLFEYAALGGTQKGLAQSLERLHPLAGLKKEHEEGFLAWIDDEEEAILERALDYYDSVLLREERMPFDEDEIFWQGGEEYEKRKAKR